jgi:biotin synthase-like enzyme
VVDNRIYEQAEDEKSKLYYVAGMLKDLVNSKQISVARVLMHSWYACQKLMFLIEYLG